MSDLRFLNLNLIRDLNPLLRLPRPWVVNILYLENHGSLLSLTGYRRLFENWSVRDKSRALETRLIIPEKSFDMRGCLCSFVISLSEQEVIQTTPISAGILHRVHLHRRRPHWSKAVASPAGPEPDGGRQPDYSNPST